MHDHDCLKLQEQSVSSSDIGSQFDQRSSQSLFVLKQKIQASYQMKNLY
jgi:hypothetical protein